jgi:bifunctional non-homologous end joining protein LigD
VARAAKNVLDSYKLSSFIKTSGQTGLHIYVPCADIDFDEGRSIASFLAATIHDKTPRISTLEISKTGRGEAAFIDAGQNDYADTLAAPYSVRPYHQPIVSTPLAWEEVSSKLDRFAFTMDVVRKRVTRYGDLFAAVLDKSIGIKNTKVLKTLLSAEP